MCIIFYNILYRIWKNLKTYNNIHSFSQSKNFKNLQDSFIYKLFYFILFFFRNKANFSLYFIVLILNVTSFIYCGKKSKENQRKKKFKLKEMEKRKVTMNLFVQGFTSCRLFNNSRLWI